MRQERAEESKGVQGCRDRRDERDRFPGREVVAGDRVQERREDG
jgi:hypothetical protein